MLPGVLNRMELRSAMEEMTGSKIMLQHVEMLFDEFDKDVNGVIDSCEFRTIMKYFNETPKPQKQTMGAKGGRRRRQSKRRSVSASKRIEDQKYAGDIRVDQQ